MMRKSVFLLVTGLLLAGSRPAAASSFFLSIHDAIVCSPGGNPSGSACVTQLQSDLDGTPPYGYITYLPSGMLTFGQLSILSAVYSFPIGTYGGGSPRFEIPLDTSGDGISDGSIFAYFGTPPNFTDTPPAGFFSTGNFILDLATTHWDLTQFGGLFYGTYGEALTLLGLARVLDVELVVDGGWRGDQLMLVDSFTVNDDTYLTACPVPEPATVLLLTIGGGVGLVRRRLTRHA